MGNAKIGPFQLNVTGEDVEKTLNTVSRFNPQVVVAVVFALTQIGMLLYLQMVVAPQNAQLIGEKVEPLRAAIITQGETISKAVVSLSASNTEQSQAQAKAHTAHIESLTAQQKEQTTLLRDLVNGLLGKQAMKDGQILPAGS